jgi:hypothetical protein
MRNEASCCLDRSDKTVMVAWPPTIINLGISILLLAAFCSLVQGAPEVFTNSFYVQLHDGHGREVADRIAKRNGFENLGSVRTKVLLY